MRSNIAGDGVFRGFHAWRAAMPLRAEDCCCPCSPPQEEAAYKLLKVTRQQVGKGGIPYIATHDGRTIRYPDPDIKVRRPLRAAVLCY